MSESVDFLIVGGGIAGHLLQAELETKGKSTILIDNPNSNRSSSVAAGIVNPVTGKFYSLTWRADEIFPDLEQYYKKWENYLDITLFKAKPILRLFSSAGEQNTWLAKSKRAKYKPYCTFHNTSIAGFNNNYGVLEINRGGRLILNNLIEGCKARYKNRNAQFDHNKLDPTEKVYMDIRYNKIVFCEGYQVLNNPFFQDINLIPTKGELIEIETEIKDKSVTYIGSVFIQHKEGNNWSVGATYDTNDQSYNPTERQKANLLRRLDSMLKLPYKVVEHFAGVRPATLDRRPLIGEHHQHKDMFLMNGFGSKGASLAPMLVSECINLMLNGKKVHQEAQLERYVSN